MANTASIGVESQALGHALQGTWYNQLGSKLTIEVDGDGVIRGTYRPGTGAVAGNTYPVAGSCRRRRSLLKVPG
jgi:Avidin family